MISRHIDAVERMGRWLDSGVPEEVVFRAADEALLDCDRCLGTGLYDGGLETLDINDIFRCDCPERGPLTACGLVKKAQGESTHAYH